MRFKIVDGKGQTVFEDVPEDHAAFITSRVAWEKAPAKLAEHEGMNGTCSATGTKKRERYRALRLPD